MNAQSGNSWQIVFALQEACDPLFDEFMENFFAASACDYTDDGKVRYIGYSSAPVDEPRMAQAAAAFGLALPAWRSEFIPAANWLTKNVIRFPPLATDDFYIYGTHEEEVPDTNKHRLRIYAATAFGSGQHQTTRLCLEFLSRLYHQGFKPAKILDMGCGSGILALAALKLWPEAAAVAADIDREAVIVTLQNAAENGLDQRLSAAAGDGYDNETVSKNAPYDLIFSNILARPLIAMAPMLAASLSPGGRAVLSGFTDEQTDWVSDAHRKQGLRPAAEEANENWRAVLMEKNK